MATTRFIDTEKFKGVVLSIEKHVVKQNGILQTIADDQKLKMNTEQEAEESRRRSEVVEKSKRDREESGPADESSVLDKIKAMFGMVSRNTPSFGNILNIGALALASPFIYEFAKGFVGEIFKSLSASLEDGTIWNGLGELFSSEFGTLVLGSAIFGPKRMLLGTFLATGLLNGLESGLNSLGFDVNIDEAAIAPIVSLIANTMLSIAGSKVMGKLLGSAMSGIFRGAGRAFNAVTGRTATPKVSSTSRPTQAPSPIRTTPVEAPTGGGVKSSGGLLSRLGKALEVVALPIATYQSATDTEAADAGMGFMDRFGMNLVATGLLTPIDIAASGANIATNSIFGTDFFNENVDTAGAFRNWIISGNRMKQEYDKRREAEVAAARRERLVSETVGADTAGSTDLANKLYGSMAEEIGIDQAKSMDEDTLRQYLENTASTVSTADNPTKMLAVQKVIDKLTTAPSLDLSKLSSTYREYAESRLKAIAQGTSSTGTSSSPTVIAGSGNTTVTKGGDSVVTNVTNIYGTTPSSSLDKGNSVPQVQYGVQ